MQVSYNIHTEIQEKGIYYQLRADIQEIIKDLCKWKGIEIEIVKGHIMSDHVHLLLSIPPKIAYRKL